MAIQAWEVAVMAALVIPLFAYARRVRNQASPDKLRGEVHEIRQSGLWKLAKGKLLVIRNDSHNTATVRLQFRSSEALVPFELQPGEAQQLATLVKAAANYDHAIDRPGGSEPSR